MESNLKLVHINLAKKRDAASTLFSNYSNHKNLLVSLNEPPFFKRSVRELNNFTNLICQSSSDKRINAAIGHYGANSTVCQIEQFTNEFCAVAEVSVQSLVFIMVSIYMSPSKDISTSLNHLILILECFNNKPILICSDTNARHTIWLDNLVNARGNAL